MASGWRTSVTTRFRILTPDAQYFDDGVVERRTSGADVQWDIFRERNGTRQNIPADILRNSDAIVLWHEMQVDAAFIAELKRCKVIVRAGVGFDHIDLRAAGEAGIPVCNTPDYGTSEVADHAIAMMLALARGIVSYQDALRADTRANYDSTLAPLVRRIRGRTLGIIGMGRIGTATALRAKAFGMNIVAYDPYAGHGMEIAIGVTRLASLDELLATSDVVSLHAPLTAETHNMIDASALRKMKPDAVLINTARGAMVDIAALLIELESGTIAGAGIDVLPIEPPERDDPVVGILDRFRDAGMDGRLILSPHAAWSSPESREDARRLSVETAMLCLREGRLRNLVNAEYLPRHNRVASLESGHAWSAGAGQQDNPHAV
jgi:phosphoglycerate dehydrogenase-like enzyme